MNSDLFDSSPMYTTAKSSEKITVGLDFGTSNTSIARSRKTKVDILCNDRRGTVTPSVVAFDGERILIGSETEASTIKPENVIFGMKSYLGRTREEIKQKKFLDRRFLTEKHQHVIQVGDRRLTVEQIVAVLFSKLKKTIEKNYGDLGGVVLTVPSSFGPLQRRALQYAAAIAELPVLQMIEETTAAAIAFACKKKEEKSRSVLIFHLGGGTIDVAIFRIAGYSLELLSSVASCDISGEDFTQQIISSVSNTLTPRSSGRESGRKSSGKKREKDDRMSLSSLFQLRTACEKAKEDLSVGKMTKLKFREIQQQLSRLEFETKNKQFLSCIKPLVERALKKAKLSKIDNYFMVGRSTMIPSVRNALRDLFGESKKKDIVNPGDGAVTGAAILAEFLTGQSGLNLQLLTNADTEKEHLFDVKMPKILQSGKLIVELFVRTQTTTGFSKRELNQMVDEVKKCSAADEILIATDEEKNRLCEAIHKTQDEIEELLKQSTSRKEKEKLSMPQKNCEELVEWICDAEAISEEDLNKHKVILQSIRRMLPTADRTSSFAEAEIRSENVTEPNKLDKAKIELDRKIRAVSDSITDELSWAQKAEWKEGIWVLHDLQKEIQNAYDWICNAENISKTQLEMCWKKVENIEKKLQEYSGIKKDYQLKISKRSGNTARFDNVLPAPGTAVRSNAVRTSRNPDVSSSSSHTIENMECASSYNPQTDSYRDTDVDLLFNASRNRPTHQLAETLVYNENEKQVARNATGAWRDNPHFIQSNSSPYEQHSNAHQTNRTQMFPQLLSSQQGYGQESQFKQKYDASRYTDSCQGRVEIPPYEYDHQTYRGGNQLRATSSRDSQSSSNMAWLWRFARHGPNL